MIGQILNEAYANNIILEHNDNKLKLIYKEGVLSEHLKYEIKQNKKFILERLRENQLASDKGFLIYNHGDLYEYRYGFGAYLYIEREHNNKVSAWRANYPKDDNKPNRIIYLVKNTTFGHAFTKAVGFIDWLKRKKRDAF
ncbi:hypothetical protein [Bacillus solimangrovi]|uniref:TubC N-terminal docking domain-containing protein n=1 Tax=Bacillus solimangrovi TaxID=1305675 RepID=A0A1E5LEM5_9BACI|nr:hypothetical protein [Bacillus solimangrovi]OEH92530.1 hypothetical protein BFG57_15450 [Bacillus solimangrovi]